MQRHNHSPEEMAELVHRAKVPAAIWGAFLVAACISAVFDENTAPTAAPASSAEVSAAQAGWVLARP